MGLRELKNKVLMEIENADEQFLTIVSDFIDFQKNKVENVVSEPTVAYDVLGKSLTLKQYNEEIDKGLEDFENGRTISHEDLLKEIKGWRNEV
jgi:predicted transcriptional regulator